MPPRRPRETAAREPLELRERIARAATSEFAARGYAGARVDAIARRAGVNKRMLYHYFGNKRALFTAVVGRRMGERARLREEALRELGEALRFWFAESANDPELARLWQWEALESRAPWVLADERRKSFQGAVASLRARQREGLLSPALDAGPLLGLFIALSMLPASYPQLLELTTGHAAGSAELGRSWRRFLGSLAAHLERGPARAHVATKAAPLKRTHGATKAAPLKRTHGATKAAPLERTGGAPRAASNPRRGARPRRELEATT